MQCVPKARASLGESLLRDLDHASLLLCVVLGALEFCESLHKATIIRLSNENYPIYNVTTSNWLFEPAFIARESGLTVFILGQYLPT